MHYKLKRSISEHTSVATMTLLLTSLNVFFRVLNYVLMCSCKGTSFTLGMHSHSHIHKPYVCRTTVCPS